MDLLNGKCNFTDSRRELLRRAIRCNSAPFPACGDAFTEFWAGNKHLKHQCMIDKKKLYSTAAKKETAVLVAVSTQKQNAEKIH